MGLLFGSGVTIPKWLILPDPNNALALRRGACPTASLDAYGDTASVSSYTPQPMAWAVGAGLIQGITGDPLRPQGQASRVQVSTILQRFIETFN